MKDPLSNNLLSKKLSKYSALALTIGGLAETNGQIVYTDLTPDENISWGDFFVLDLDNNNSLDFQFANYFSTYCASGQSQCQGYTTSVICNYYDTMGNCVSSSTWQTCSSYAYVCFNSYLANSKLAAYNANGNAIAKTMDGQIKVLDNGETISQSLDWTSNSFYYMAQSYNGSSGCFGNWCGEDNKFVGLRFQINGNTHYGWARLTVNSPHWAIVNDYAYNTIPDEEIDAGQTTLDVPNTSLESIRIYTKDKSIKLRNIVEPLEYRIFSLSGQLILSGGISNNDQIIEAQNLADGFYILELSNLIGNSFRSKIIL